MKNQKSRLDLITILPPPIIESILCLIPLKEAIRTSILSKEWKHPWTKIPKLVFNDDTVQLTPNESQLPDHRLIKTRKLINAINQVMSFRQGPIIDFTLEMDADDKDTCVELDRILTNLGRNNMFSKLSIDLTHGCELPLDLFSQQMVTDLYLRNCDIIHQPVFSGFGSVTSFCLHDVNIYTKTLLHLLSSSPFLKNFRLLICQDNILSREYATMIELFSCLPNMEHFISWGWLIPCFAWGPVPRELPNPLVRLKSLSLDTLCFLDEYGLPFVIMLIRSAPNLQKLKLEVIPEGLDDYWLKDLDFVTRRKYSDFWLEHLTDFEIEGFSNLKPELDFVKLILAKSPLLKKARIVLNHYFPEYEEILELATALSRSPHPSSEVDIVVELPEYER